MDTVRIGDHPCEHPRHDPPKHLAPGVYLHTCPLCGRERRIEKPRYSNGSWAGEAKVNR